MSTKRCVVPNCTSQGTKGFSKFPENIEEKELWMKLCGISLLENSKNFICHKHFKDWCFVDNANSAYFYASTRPYR